MLGSSTHPVLMLMNRVNREVKWRSVCMGRVVSTERLGELFNMDYGISGI